MAGRFWEFQHLTDSWRGTNPMDLVPRTEGKLYIGGLAALYKEPDPLKSAGITHVVSALDFDINDAKQLRDYKHLVIQVDDTPDEDLLKHFPKTTEFIDEALQGDNGKVFVHCAMGVSRSASVVCAYLMWKFGIGSLEAVEWVREGRKRVQPNPGFVRQLEVWGEMVKKKEKGTAVREVWDEMVYGEWKGKRGSVAEWVGGKGRGKL